MRLIFSLMPISLGLANCSQEARQIGPSIPQTAPVADDDPRIPAYQGNVYQMSQGGRYFLWYGCSACHGDAAPGFLNLASTQRRRGSGFAQVYRAIGDAHRDRKYDAHIPAEQLWQITAYIRDLPLHTPEKRNRLGVDQSAEPAGSTWPGPQ
jgi:mono/diheme cytochrome c family protein